MDAPITPVIKRNVFDDVHADDQMATLEAVHERYPRLEVKTEMHGPAKDTDKHMVLLVDMFTYSLCVKLFHNDTTVYIMRVEKIERRQTGPRTTVACFGRCCAKNHVRSGQCNNFVNINYVTGALGLCTTHFEYYIRHACQRAVKNKLVVADVAFLHLAIHILSTSTELSDKKGRLRYELTPHFRELCQILRDKGYDARSVHE